MTDKEVLQRAIGIAEDNDLNYECLDYHRLTAILPVSNEVDYRGIIFSHDFAKAFFPKEMAKMVWYNELNPYSFEDCESWKVHLMKMVLCDNPIDYLRKFVDNTENSETI